LAASAVTLAPARPARAADPTMQECVSSNEQAGPLQRAGKLREARANMLRCSAASCPTVVRDDCIKAATQLDQAVPTVVFEVHDASGNETSAVRVSMDGRPLADALTGTAIDVDPGEHVFRFETPGGSVERRFVIHEGEKNRRERVAVGADGPGAQGSAAAAAGGAGEAPAAASSGLSEQKKIAIGVGGLGLAGVAVGSILGLLANSRWQQAKTDCGAGCALGTPARDEASSAHGIATVANITFFGGLVAVGAGAAIWLLAPSPQGASASLRIAPLVASSGAGLTAVGSLP
jgi:hypothetical protein